MEIVYEDDPSFDIDALPSQGLLYKEINDQMQLGKILLKYIDRLKDPSPCDSLENIVVEIIDEAEQALGLK